MEVTEADLANPDHQDAILLLLDAYARDPMGNGRPLDEAIRRNLIPGLRSHPTTLVLLAYLDRQPVGIAVCFYGFSTFAAAPLINLHDFAVLPGYREHGIGRKLLAALEAKARQTNCCKITLEVLENNHRARKVYASAGFRKVTYVDEAGAALFLAKTI
jgi:GNAT superfamily N-acetyltransferase